MSPTWRFDSWLAPRPVSNLTLNMKDSSLEATWNTDKCLNFTVQLLLNGKPVNETTTKEKSSKFKNLNTAAYYTVVVRAVSGHLIGPAQNASDYTREEWILYYCYHFYWSWLTSVKDNLIMYVSSLFAVPRSPTDASVTGQTKNTITFEWKAPDNVVTVNYAVNLTSAFWNQAFSDTVMNKTSYTFGNLTSGSNYIFEVFTLAGETKSESSKCEGSTGKILTVMDVNTWSSMGFFQTFPSADTLFHKR